MEKWTLRRAVPADVDQLVSCIGAAYADHAARLADLPPMTEDLSLEVERKEVWVAVIGERIAGTVILAPGDAAMLLANVAVHPDHQGIGLGRALLSHADTEALARGYREMRLNTHAGMADNLSLYRRLGWEETDRKDNKVSMRKRFPD